MSEAVLIAILVSLVGELGVLTGILYYLRRGQQYLAEIVAVEEVQQEEIAHLHSALEELCGFAERVRQACSPGGVFGELRTDVRATRLVESELLQGIRALRGLHGIPLLHRGNPWVAPPLLPGER